MSLAEARRRAEETRRLAAEGVDPVAHRASLKAEAASLAARAMSFRQCAEAYLAAHQASWRNAKHRAQWASTLETYAFPVFGHLPVMEIDIFLVMKALDPIWKTKTETASRLRGRIEAVLDWAAVRGYRSGDNPARWKGHLQKLLPPRSKIQRIRHFAALPHADIPAFMTKLRERQGNAARALEFLILTATRTNETLGATWDEIDIEAKVWTIPTESMKANREHRVPLAAPALAILKRLKAERSDPLCPWVFEGTAPGKPLSSMALLMVLRRMERTDLTVHGFRSTFRDWAAEQTNFPREVCEAALAHAIGDKTEAAYRRSDLFEKRARLMDAWARYCKAAPLASERNVVPLTRPG